MNIAIIPARLGSKRISNKNIKNFCGYPIISYSIKNALKSNTIDKVYVSTESNQIAEVAIKYGANVPFLRDKNLADDYTTTIDVVKDFISKIIKTEGVIDHVCCLYPCSPLADSKLIDLVFRNYIKSKCDFAYPIIKYGHTPYRALKKGSNNKMEFLFTKNELKRTQDFEPLFHDAGQFYWGRTKALIRISCLYSSKG